MDSERGVFIVVCLLVLTWAGCQGRDAEQKLIKTLTDPDVYDMNARPVLDKNQAIKVRVDLVARKLIQLDEKDELMRSNIWLRMYWTDEHLTWNASDYGGIEAVHIYPANNIWRPDIVIENEVSDEQQDLGDLYPAIVSSDGSVAWLSKQILKTTCRMDVSSFPWDTQRCNYTFLSWTYDVTGIDIDPVRYEAETESFMPDGQWKLDGVPVNKHLIYPSCCPNPYAVLDYTLVLTRKPLYYIVNLIIPALCTSVVGVMVFCLPVDSGEKVSLSVTVLLAATVFLLMLSDSLPTQSDVVPQAGQFFMSTIIFMSLCTVLTVIILNMHGRGKYADRVPRLVRKVFIERFGRVVMHTARDSFIHRKDNTVRKSDVRGKRLSALSGSVVGSPVMSTSIIASAFVPRRKDNASGEYEESGVDAGFETSFVDRQTSPNLSTMSVNPRSEQWVSQSYSHHLLEKMAKSLDIVASQNKASEKRDQIEGEWMYLALLLDRTLLVVFMLGVTLTSVAILIRNA